MAPDVTVRQDRRKYRSAIDLMRTDYDENSGIDASALHRPREAGTVGVWKCTRSGTS
jgi:hypothetical protein